MTITDSLCIVNNIEVAKFIRSHAEERLRSLEKPLQVVEFAHKALTALNKGTEATCS